MPKHQMHGGVPVWGDVSDRVAIEQMLRCRETADGGALMADHHVGYAVPIGGVVVYRDRISPSGVGYDIGCGNKAVQLDVPADEVRRNIATLMDDIAANLSFGMGRRNPTPVEHIWPDDDAEEEASAGQDPANPDERERVTRQTMARRDQMTFRNGVRRRFGERCAVSGCAILQLVEAAHTRPYRGPRENHPSIGLLLRAHIHTLFDLSLIVIHPQTLKVHVHPDAAREGYERLAGNSLRGAARPDREALEQRWALFQRRCRPITPRESRSRG